MLEAARRNRVWSFALASSAAVYGDGKVPNREDQIPIPLSPYAASKLAGEHYCKVYSQIYGLETSCLRYFNVFGPRQSPESEYAAVIPKFIGKALRGETLEVYGDGEQSRDFVYVYNVVLANVAAAFRGRRAETNVDVFNIGSGKSISVNGLIDKLETLTGNKLAVKHLEPRAGEIKHSRASVSKAKRRLDYYVAIDFDEGLSRTIDYLKEG